MAPGAGACHTAERFAANRSQSSRRLAHGVRRWPPAAGRVRVGVAMPHVSAAEWHRRSRRGPNWRDSAAGEEQVRQHRRSVHQRALSGVGSMPAVRQLPVRSEHEADRPRQESERRVHDQLGFEQPHVPTACADLGSARREHVFDPIHVGAVREGSATWTGSRRLCECERRNASGRRGWPMACNLTAR